VATPERSAHCLEYCPQWQSLQATLVENSLLFLRFSSIPSRRSRQAGGRAV